MKLLLLLFTIAICVSCSNTYYIVRHADKATAAPNMTSDVPLSAEGKERAEVLKNNLRNKKIQQIFSTNTIRTRTTVEPLSIVSGVTIQTYDPRDTGFVNRMKMLDKGNVLIVGHSNTVDDLVNSFLNKTQLQDLPDAQYGDLFIIKKKGSGYKLSTRHFGK